jgi:hypothetical protein
MDDMTDDDVRNGSVLPMHQVSAADRLQRFNEDDRALAELAVRVHQRAMGDGENANAAGHLDLRLRERRAAMWGYDSPIRFDMVAVEAHKEPSSFDQIHAAIMRVVEEAPPAQRALRKRLEELTAEEALERLGLPQPDGETGPEITQ